MRRPIDQIFGQYPFLVRRFEQRHVSLRNLAVSHHHRVGLFVLCQLERQLDGATTETDK